MLGWMSAFCVQMSGLSGCSGLESIGVLYSVQNPEILCVVGVNLFDAVTGYATHAKPAGRGCRAWNFG